MTEKNLDNTYWNGNGKYQDWHNALEEQVPTEGKADKIHIDLLRCVANLYYDHFNNGGCNWDVRKPEFWQIVYRWEELDKVAEAEGVKMLRLFLDGIRDTMERVERFEEITNEKSVQKWLDSLDSKWETLVNIVVRYAWEVEIASKKES